MSSRQSYLAKQDANKRNRQAAGFVAEKLPDVESMVIDMVYYQNLSNPVLMLRKLNVFPSSYAYFKMDCMIKECEDGYFDLTQVIRDMVKSKKKVLKGSMKCKGGANRKDLGPDHASIDYEISVNYYRKGAPRPDISALKAAEKEPVRRGPGAPMRSARKSASPVAASAPQKKAQKRSSGAERVREAARKVAAKKKAAAAKKSAPKKSAVKKKAAAAKKSAPKKAAVKKKAAPKKAVSSKGGKR